MTSLYIKKILIVKFPKKFLKDLKIQDISSQLKKYKKLNLEQFTSTRGLNA